MTRRAAGLLAACLAVAAAGATAGEAPAPLTVAAVLDLTGPGAALGEAERIGIKLAEREVAARGGVGGRPLRVIVLDGATSAATAARGARHAIEQERVLLLIGGTTGATVAALAESTRRAEVPLLALAEARRAADPQGDGRWSFQVPPGQALVAETIARDLERRGLRRLAWLEAEGPIGAAGRAAFEPAARRRGLEIVARERVAEGSGDPAAAAVAALLASTPEALVVWAIPPLAGALAQPVRDLAPGLPHYQSHAAATGTFLALAGAAAAGIRTVQLKLPLADRLPESDPQRPAVLEFLRRARAERGLAVTEPSPFGGYGYDAVRIAAAALERVLPGWREGAPPVARRRADLREALEATREHVGVSGVFSYGPDDHTGLDARALVLVEAVVPPGAKRGEWRPVP